MISKLDSYLGFNETALRLRGYRQEVLASNLANVDTPNYKAKDFSFPSALQAAVQGQVPGNMQMTDPRHLGSATGSALEPGLLFRNEHQASIDGNTVESDVEMAEFSQNAIRYQAQLTFLNAKIASLRAAFVNQ